MPQAQSEYGFFITFEGIDACGKSTQVRLLYEFLRKRGRQAIQLRDPGATLISERIRAILLDRNHSLMSPWTELLLYEAARAQMVHETIQPALAAGTIVLSDRYYDSTTAYQGYARGLDLEMVNQANRIGSCGVVPDLTFFIDIDPKVAAQRKKDLGERSDRMEAEGLAFQEKVRYGFQQLSVKEPNRVFQIDGHRSIDAIQQEIQSMFKQNYEQTSSGDVV